jgi:small subunit ribosomal protein S13
MRIIGVEIPDKERIEVGLTRIFGIGSTNVKKLIKTVNLDPNLRVKDLSRDQASKLMKVLENFKTEGDLKKEIRENIDRLRAIKSYRGIRHIVNLPVRGQRTKTNARTVKGKKKTVGSLTKEAWAKIEAQQKTASRSSNT